MSKYLGIESTWRAESGSYVVYGRGASFGDLTPRQQEWCLYTAARRAERLGLVKRGVPQSVRA